MDLIDSLMEEWYPGLLDRMPSGESLVRQLIPCIQCSKSQRHQFTLCDLLGQIQISDEILCPNHEESVPLSLLAPDVNLSDLEPHHLVDCRRLHFEERSLLCYASMFAQLNLFIFLFVDGAFVNTMDDELSFTT